jgi:hypothetical protein
MYKILIILFLSLSLCTLAQDDEFYLDKEIYYEVFAHRGIVMPLGSLASSKNEKGSGYGEMGTVNSIGAAYMFPFGSRLKGGLIFRYSSVTIPINKTHLIANIQEDLSKVNNVNNNLTSQRDFWRINTVSYIGFRFTYQFDRISLKMSTYLLESCTIKLPELSFETFSYIPENHSHYLIPNTNYNVSDLGYTFTQSVDFKITKFLAIYLESDLIFSKTDENRSYFNVLFQGGGSTLQNVNVTNRQNVRFITLSAGLVIRNF